MKLHQKKVLGDKKEYKVTIVTEEKVIN